MPRKTFLLFSLVIVSALILSACQPAPQTETSGGQSTNPETSSVMVAPGNKLLTLETTYQSPAQLEKVSFMVAVDPDGVITSAASSIQAENPVSVMRQESFAKDLPAVLVGKKLADLDQIDRVGGSSLTTGAFNKALAELKTQL